MAAQMKELQVGADGKEPATRPSLGNGAAAPALHLASRHDLRSHLAVLPVRGAQGLSNSPQHGHRHAPPWSDNRYLATVFDVQIVHPLLSPYSSCDSGGLALTAHSGHWPSPLSHLCCGFCELCERHCSARLVPSAGTLSLTSVITV